ncbi:MAG: Ldh family oxidoreductase [Actinomycetota bacterium]
MSDSTFTPEVLETLTTRVLIGMGAPKDSAETVARSLVLSNLVGHDSHGIIRLAEYSGWVQGGKIIPAALPTIAWKKEATASIDGGWGWGQTASALATKTVIDTARELGTATVVLSRTNHVGRLGEYVDDIANAGMMGISFCNTGGAAVAPFGGIKKILGTNPFAWSLPGVDGYNLVLDFSTAVVAAGKVVLAAMSGESIEPGSLIDKDGKPSTRPQDFEEGGALLAFGGHKGSGMSVLIDVASGMLSGNLPAIIANTGFGNGTVIIAVDIARFVNLDVFRGVAEQFAVAMHGASAPAGPSVSLPGELEAKTKAQRISQGVYIAPGVQKGIAEVAALYGVSVPEFEAAN